MKRAFVKRPAEDIREAAAKLCERMAGQHHKEGCLHMELKEAAKRIRRIPLAGFFKAKKT